MRALVPWRKVLLGGIAQVQTGISVSATRDLSGVTEELPYLRVANVKDGSLDLAEVKTIRVPKEQVPRYLLRDGDVLLTEGGDFDKLGRGCVWHQEIELCLHQNHVFAVRPDQSRLLPDFLAALCGSRHGKSYFLGCSKQTTNLASINSTQIKDFPVLVPPIEVQRRICDVLEAWSRALELQRKLIRARLGEKRFLAKRLLTDTKRFSESKVGRHTHSGRPERRRTSDWEYQAIGQIAGEVKDRNEGKNGYPVLSCSKHRGLVSSLDYFGKRVFSSDTSNYKVVRRGQFAYATNHIEEGSIGLLTTHEAGLISPIYTVFETDPHEVHAPFLFRLFKTDMYRHIFEANTSSSVNRRGSLRWAQFAKIQVPLPSIGEQRAIADTLDAIDREIELLTQKADALARQKKGLMEKLLTGQIRAKV